MARTKAISLIQSGSTKTDLAELSGLVIANIQKDTLAQGLKSGDTHPLIVIAGQKWVSRQAPHRVLGLEELTEWLAGKLELEHIHFHLRQLLRETLKPLELRARQRSLTLRCEVTELTGPELLLSGSIGGQRLVAEDQDRQGHEQAAGEHPLHVFEGAVARGLQGRAGALRACVPGCDPGAEGGRRQCREKTSSCKHHGFSSCVMSPLPAEFLNAATQACRGVQVRPQPHSGGQTAADYCSTSACG